MSHKRGLGRGLDALIPAESPFGPPPTAGTVGVGLLEAAVGDIQPNPHQPRLKLDDEQLNELAASIREHGLIQPLVVTRLAAPSSDGIAYQLIAGERRWRAAQKAGLERVPVIVKEVAPQEMLELALVENVQRADLNPLEEAHAYRQLIDEFGLTQDQVARRVGKSRVAIANTSRLLKACAAIKKALLDEEIHEGHARALLALETDEAQEAALAVVLKQGLNVRQTESLVRRLTGEVEPPPPAPPPSPQTQSLETAFRERLGTKVTLQRNEKGAGRVVIHFYSDEELQHLYERIVGVE
jgi:ParB family chromosome partitioning protein